METKFLKVKVHAGAKKARAVEKSPDGWEIWVKEPAERGRANRAVAAILEASLSKGWRVKLVKGARRSSKIFLAFSKSPPGGNG